MNISELTGDLLDKWVGLACGYELDEYGYNRTLRDNGGAPSEWHPSTDWAQGGEIIDREKIDLRFNGDAWVAGFNSEIESSGYGTAQMHWIEPSHMQVGPTALTAAMRAFIASKYGETVPDE